MALLVMVHWPTIFYNAGFPKSTVVPDVASSAWKLFVKSPCLPALI